MSQEQLLFKQVMDLKNLIKHKIRIMDKIEDDNQRLDDSDMTASTSSDLIDPLTEKEHVYFIVENVDASSPDFGSKIKVYIAN